jgi:HlyD family secretion protein
MSNPKQKTKKRRKILIAAVILLALGSAGAFVGFKKREPVIEIQTEKVSKRDITEVVVANGRVQPVVQVVIQPEVSGEIIELPVKEGQLVKKGDLLVKIKPDNYVASRNSAEANYKSLIANANLAKANLEKARLELVRFEQLHTNNLVSDSQYLEAKTSYEVMQAGFETAGHQTEQAKASLARAEDDLSKTTISSPIDGTVTKLRSQRGERVVGTSLMAGTEIMTIADLNAIEARVDVGEIDVVLIKLGQKARLEIEAFHDRKFNGLVTEIANAAKGSASSQQQQSQGGGQQQEATKFEVKILLTEKEEFRPGMSVTAEIETRSKTNVLCVPIMAVTARTPKGENEGKKEEEPKEQNNSVPLKPKKEEGPKATEVVFLVNGETAKMAKVKSGISDDSYMEITEGLSEGQEIISGGYAAVSRQLDDGKKIKKAKPKKNEKKAS